MPTVIVYPHLRLPTPHRPPTNPPTVHNAGSIIEAVSAVNEDSWVDFEPAGAHMVEWWELDLSDLPPEAKITHASVEWRQARSSWTTLHAHVSALDTQGRAQIGNAASDNMYGFRAEYGPTTWRGPVHRGTHAGRFYSEFRRLMIEWHNLGERPSEPGQVNQVFWARAHVTYEVAEPSATIVEPVGEVDYADVIAWDYEQPDGRPQSHYRVTIWPGSGAGATNPAGSGALFDTGKLIGAGARSTPITVPLPPGTYTAWVKVWSTMSNGVPIESAWSSVEFSVENPPTPPAPLDDLSVTWQDDGGVRVDATPPEAGDGVLLGAVVSIERSDGGRPYAEVLRMVAADAESFGPPVRYWDASTALAAIDAATSIAELQAALDPVGDLYGFEFIVHTSTTVVDFGSRSYEVTPSALEPAQRTARGIVSELGKYRTEATNASPLHSWHIVATMEDTVNGGFGGAAVSTAGDQLMIYTGHSQEHWYRQRAHTGLFYSLEDSMPAGERIALGEQWAANNPPGFTYGPIEEQPPYTGDHPPGFVNDDARVAIGWDMSETHMFLMMDDTYATVRAWADTDPALAGKIALLRQSAVAYWDPVFSYALSAGPVSWVDYDAPMQTWVTYRARLLDPAQLSASDYLTAPAVHTVNESWFIMDPAAPELNLIPEVAEYEVVDTRQSVVVRQGPPLAASTVATSGPLGDRITVTFRTLSRSDREALQAVLDSGRPFRLVDILGRSWRVLPAVDVGVRMIRLRPGPTDHTALRDAHLITVTFEETAG